MENKFEKTVRELSKQEFEELKESYLLDNDVDEVEDEKIFEEFDGVYFVEDDFWCNKYKED